MTGSDHSAPILWFDTLGHDHHETGGWHPERAARLPAVAAAAAEPALAEAIRRGEARPATRTELERAHSPRYLDALTRQIEGGGGAIDTDTQTSPGSWDTALWAAGSALCAAEELAADRARSAFVAVRPPGHHATAAEAMGFCLINTIAVVAASLVANGARVAIFDWDVHHGNGTQDIFWDDDQTLYASIHQHPAYPGTGRAGEVGGPKAKGNTVNVPLPAGASGHVALAAFDDLIGPEIDRFAPDWILVSAGYDAHRSDPLGDLRWTAGDYHLLTKRVLSLVPAGRTLFLLEGGYDLGALTRSVSGTLAAMAELSFDAPAMHEAPSSDGPGLEAVTVAARRRDEALQA